MSCEKCGREIKNYGVFLGGIRCANFCNISGVTDLPLNELICKENSMNKIDVRHVTMSNAIARRYFLHANDFRDDEVRCCFFANGLGEDGWGFWVGPDGTVDVDDVSSSGELPSKRIIDACVRAAVKFLKSR